MTNEDKQLVEDAKKHPELAASILHTLRQVERLIADLKTVEADLKTVEATYSSSPYSELLLSFIDTLQKDARRLDAIVKGIKA